MPRPRKCRLVSEQPKATFYKPRGVPLAELQEEVLPVEGLEALRLAEVEGLDHQAAAERMGVSRPTFSRILAHARRRVSRALVWGRALRIEGGDYSLRQRPGRRFGRVRRRGCDREPDPMPAQPQSQAPGARDQGSDDSS